MERDKLDFGNGRIGQLFRAMFFPTLIGMVFNSALNICDGMFVGHGVGSNALAAINIVAPLFLICTGVGLMFGIGASVIGGIRLAEGNVKAARIIMTQAYIAGAVIFGLVVIGSLLFTRPLLYLLGCSEALEGLATDYLLWLLPGLVFFLPPVCGNDAHTPRRLAALCYDGADRGGGAQHLSRLVHGVSARHGHPWRFDGHFDLVYCGGPDGGGLFHLFLR